MATATGSTIARNGNGRRLPRHQARMIQTEIKFVLNQDEGSYGASFFGLKWYTIAPPHRYNFSPALTAIKALLFGFSHEQVSALYGVSRRTLSRWVTWFNERGIDGLLDRPRTGRPRKIGPEKGEKFRKLIQHPDEANEIHWTAKKFHGYVTKQLEDDIGYRTLLRWLHEEGFRLKVPRPWPNGQDEEKRQAFVDQLKTYLNDPDVEIWYLDETGIEGDPRPRRRWAKKGEKIRQLYEGTHIRMNVTGAVCPRTGEFYALILPHSDTEIFQVFLDQANQDIQFERKRNLLICDNASWHKRSSLNWGRFERIFLSTVFARSQPH